MSSKMKGHIDLPDEILLDILEHMDTATRESFMATNKVPEYKSLSESHGDIC